jgi:hypothetical protein
VGAVVGYNITDMAFHLTAAALLMEFVVGKVELSVGGSPPAPLPPADADVAAEELSRDEGDGGESDDNGSAEVEE